MSNCPHFPDPFRSDLYGYRGDQAVWKVKHYFRYTNPDHPLVTVPMGALTDGASVPRVFHNILGPTGRYFRAAVIHDYLYSMASTSHYSGFTRKMADDLFRDAVQDCGCSAALAFTMWAGVRAAGWRFYKKPESKVDKI